MARVSASFVKEWERNPEVLDLYRSSPRNFPDSVDADTARREQFERDAAGALGDQAKVLAATLGPLAAPASLVSQTIAGLASGAVYGSTGDGTVADMGAGAAVGAILPSALRAAPYVWRAATSTTMRPGYIRFPTASGEKATFVPVSRDVPGADMLNRMYAGAFDVSRVRVPVPGGASSGAGGVSLNQTLADALRPARVMIEDTVDRTVARTGNSLYFGMTGEETALLNPGKIVRHGPSPWNAAVETRIRDLAPKIGPSSPTAYRVGVEGRTITEKTIAEFNKSVGEAAPSVSESVWSAPRSGMLGRRTADVYKSAQDTIRKIYADKEAVKALNSAFRTGNFDDPVMKLYLAAKESYSASKAQLGRYAAKYTKGSPGAWSPSGEFSEAVSAQNLASSEGIARRITGKKTFAERAASVKPGTLWSDHIFPWLAEHPIKNSLKVAAWTAIPTLALTSWVKSGSEKRSQDGTTDEVKKNLDPIKENYLALTNNNAVASAMSDASLLRQSLFALRDNAEAEMTAYPDRGGSVRAAVNAYLDRVGESPVMRELISRNEEAYRGIANGEDFRSEFRARYPDVLSRAIGDDFYKGVLGGAR